MKRLFLIPSLLAAGFGGKDANSSTPEVASNDHKNSQPMFDVFKRKHTYDLAGHRSHSSHASHSSHRSSSGGSVYVPRKPLYNPTPPQQIMPTVPEAPKKLPGFSSKFKAIVMEVQTCLLSYGYYHGPINGMVDVETSAAISKLQAQWNLPVTGTVTPEVLDACRTTLY